MRAGGWFKRMCFIMKYTITTGNNFTGKAYGLTFVGGCAETEDDFLAARLRSKGYSVTAEKMPPTDDEHAKTAGTGAGSVTNADTAKKHRTSKDAV